MVFVSLVNRAARCFSTVYFILINHPRRAAGLFFFNRPQRAATRFPGA